MNTLTSRQREILEIAQDNAGKITTKQVGRTELNRLVQRGYISIAPAGAFRITSQGTQAVDTPVGGDEV